MRTTAFFRAIVVLPLPGPPITRACPLQSRSCWRRSQTSMEVTSVKPPQRAALRHRLRQRRLASLAPLPPQPPLGCRPASGKPRRPASESPSPSLATRPPYCLQRAWPPNRRLCCFSVLTVPTSSGLHRPVAQQESRSCRCRQRIAKSSRKAHSRSSDISLTISASKPACACSQSTSNASVNSFFFSGGRTMKS